MPSEISIHDNILLSYTVDCQARSITVYTTYKGTEPSEHTNVVFSNVTVYHFEGDNFGTISFDITEVAPEEVYLAYQALFIRRKDYGWLPVAYVTEDDLMRSFAESNIKGYLLTSSYGMDGFVLAQKMSLISV